MNSMHQVLRDRLEKKQNDFLYRQLRQIDSAQAPRINIAGKEYLNFSSNDYLGLANHPEVVEGAVKAVCDYGAGAGSSRLICGSLRIHHQLEEKLASFKGVEAALCFSTGFAAALGTIPALISKEDIVIVDKLAHACLLDGIRLSGAKLRIFHHNDLDDLESILQWATRTLEPGGNILIITESVFSMDGDQAPLREIVALKARYGAWLMVDEAHASGLFGQRGSGLIEDLGLTDQVEIQMGTLGKALGAAGGYITGSRTLIDYLINQARSFIFSTAPNPASSGAVIAALRLLEKEGADRRRNVWKLVHHLRNKLSQLTAQIPSSLIHPFIIGDEQNALRLSKSLFEQGIMVPAIRFPTVPKNRARLRITVTHDHSLQEIDRLCQLLPSQSG